MIIVNFYSVGKDNKPVNEGQIKYDGKLEFTDNTTTRNCLKELLYDVDADNPAEVMDALYGADRYFDGTYFRAEVIKDRDI